tara:strand:+ start:31 stop:1656 length:1626 start_codon:yes stop_codon:yes gene_type:complete
MRITSGGNVCVGSTDSGVSGTIDLSVGLAGTTTGGITLWSTTTGSHSLGFGDGTTGTDRYEGYIEYDHNDNSMEIATNHTVAMRIDSSGNAIFTKSGGAYLQLKDASAVRGSINVTTSDGLSFTTGASFTEAMRITSGGVVQCGSPTTGAQSIAKLSSRVNGAAIEFGHTNNTAQYYGTLGSFGSNGSPYIGFSTFCESGVNTFTTNGAAGNIIVSDAGHLKFQQVTTATATGQTPADRMTINSAGNLGLGTTDPSSDAIVRVLEIDDSTSAGIALDAVATYSIYSSSSSTLTFRDESNATTRMVLDANGIFSLEGNYLKCNNVAGDKKLQFNRTGGKTISLEHDTGKIYFYNETDASVMMTIDNNGKVTTGGAYDSNYALYVIDANNRTQATSQFHINGSGYSAFHWLDATAYYINQNSTIRSLRIYSGTSGGVELAAGGTSWGTFSDETEKENIKPLDNVLDKIKDYRCVKFNFKEDEEKETKIGFIAQDWENDFGEVVYKSKNRNEEEKLAMKYTETMPVLLKAIQELKAEIDELKNK